MLMGSSRNFNWERTSISNGFFPSWSKKPMKSAMTASRALPVLQKEKRPALSKPFFMKKTTDLTALETPPLVLR